MAVSKVIAKTEHFRIEVGELTMLPDPYRGNWGYRLINNRTDLCEVEGTSEAGAIRAMHANSAWMQSVLEDPTGENQPHPELPDEVFSVLPTDGGVN